MKRILTIFVLILCVSCSEKENPEKVDLTDNKEIEIVTENVIDKIIEEPIEEKKGNYGRSTTNLLRIRSIPDINYGEVLEKINTDDEVEILSRTQWNTNIDGITDRWLEIKTEKGITGWVFEGYMKYKSITSIPISDVTFEINEDDILRKINEMISNQTSEIGFPSEFNTDHNIIPSGYVNYKGILLWTEGSSLWGFNGQEISPIFNINILSKDNRYMIGPIYKFTDSKIFITKSHGRFASFIVNPYFIFDLETCEIKTDEDKLFEKLIADEDKYPYRKNCNLLYEGYKKIINGKMYGIFRNNERSSVYTFDGNETNFITNLPDEFYGSAISIQSESVIIVYEPKNGWGDEDTTGPYLTTDYDFLNDKIIEERLMTEEELWNYLGIKK